MIYKYPKIMLEGNIRLHIILLEMTKYKIGCCFFVDDKDRLLGILTDGDIRRLILQNSNIDTIGVEDINTEYYYESGLNKKMTDIRNEGYIPILREQKILGIIKKTHRS
jgi:CBS domain-containing protein